METQTGAEQPLLLLVEDDADAAQFFRIVLGKITTGWRMVHVADGLEAVQYMMENAMPDLIVTDLQMPRMTGQELIAWVRANLSNRRIPILVLSCCSQPGLGDLLHELGADEYVCKFSPLNDLKGAVYRHTQRTYPDELISTIPSLN